LKTKRCKITYVYDIYDLNSIISVQTFQFLEIKMCRVSAGRLSTNKNEKKLKFIWDLNPTEFAGSTQNHKKK
jgi:hypothetical protein